MLSRIIFLALVLMQVNLCSAQKKKDNTKLITISNSGARDIIITDSTIWLLAQNGKLYLIDNNYNTKKIFSFKSKIKAIANDTSGNVITAEANGTLTKINELLDTQIVAYTSQTPLDLIITKSDKYLLITDKGIFLPEDERLYYENSFKGTVGMVFRTNWRPFCYYLDGDDNLWMGFGAGEWGGDVVIFSSRLKRFTNINERLKKNCYLRPVKSIFPVDSSIFVSTSLMHFKTSSFIIEFKDSCKNIFESAGYSDTLLNQVNDDGLYIGPAVFNSSDSSIYMYCDLGVYKSRINDKIDDFKNWEKIFETNLLWSSGQPDAVGSPMNVRKLIIHNSKIFLVSPENGLIIWDAAKKIQLK